MDAGGGRASCPAADNTHFLEDSYRLHGTFIGTGDVTTNMTYCGAGAEWNPGPSHKKKDFSEVLDFIGGEDEDRTHDLCIANAALSQLSYPPE